MPEFTWDHTHIKTYDVVGSAAWLQDKLGARSVEGTTVSEARADLLRAMGQHVSYHVGQIALLRRMMGAWPPPGGGDTW